MKFSQLLFFILLLPYTVYCSTADSSAPGSFVVDSIAISGNDITQDYIILNELTFSAGDRVDDEILRYNRERIFSLGLFTNVQLFMDRHFNNTLRIFVRESWYIWPLPFVNFKDNDIKKTTYGLNVLYKNFRGRNETLSGVVGLGYDPFYSFSYFNPWLIREKSISFAASTSFQRFQNVSRTTEIMMGRKFESKIISGNLSVGKRLDIYNDLSFTTGFDYIELPEYKSGIATASLSRIDHLLKAGISYAYDSRNLKQLPDSGIYAGISFIHKGFGIRGVDYSVIYADLRHYSSIIGDLSAKWRIAARHALGGDIPFYDYSYLGSGEKIRGRYNNIVEGHHLYIGSAELKYPIIKEWNFSIKLPVIPQTLTTYRIAVYTNLFIDTGVSSFEHRSIRLNDFDSGYGAGLIFVLLPYNIMRLEYALDEYKNGEFILGFGFSF